MIANIMLSHIRRGAVAALVGVAVMMRMREALAGLELAISSVGAVAAFDASSVNLEFAWPRESGWLNRACDFAEILPPGVEIANRRDTPDLNARKDDWQRCDLNDSALPRVTDHTPIQKKGSVMKRTLGWSAAMLVCATLMACAAPGTRVGTTHEGYRTTVRSQLWWCDTFPEQCRCNLDNVRASCAIVYSCLNTRDCTVVP